MNNAMTQSNGKKEAVHSSLFTTRQLVTLAMLSALAYVLMLIHLPFKYLGFLELEFSDVPAVIASLVYGPVAGVVVELIKNVIKAITATTTGGIGELANFLISACYVIPVGILFQRLKGKAKVFESFAAGIAGFVTAGVVVNYFITVPLYANLFGGMDVVVGAAAATVPAIKDLATIVILGITPFNVVKGLLVSFVGYLVYKLFRKSLV
ncbi:MAG: ECF transporter S component [Acetivibrio ethanolgignens]